MISRFCVRPISKWEFLKIIQVNMKHDPFDAGTVLSKTFVVETPNLCNAFKFM